MAFRIRMGVPEMEAFWNDLSDRKLAGKLDECFGLTARTKEKSRYLRLKPHPEDEKRGAYQRIKLASLRPQTT